MSEPQFPQFPVPLDRDVAEALAGLTSDQREAFEERAAILEYDAGLPRRTAERRALAEVLTQARRTPLPPGTP